jgi:hypothetical protein
LINGDGGFARSRTHSTAKERHSEQQSPHFFISSFPCSHLAEVYVSANARFALDVGSARQLQPPLVGRRMISFMISLARR